MTSTKNLYDKLDKNNFSVSNYCYPENLGTEEFIHAIQISIYKRVSGIDNINNRNIGNGGQAKSFRTNNPIYNSKSALMGSTSRLSETITLYMPSELSSEYNLSYNNTEIDNKMFNAINSLNYSATGVRDFWALNSWDAVGKKIKDASSNIFNDSITGVKNLFNNLSSKSGIEKLTVSDSTKSSATQVGLNLGLTQTATSLMTKVAKNPHMEYIFEKISNRVFTFKFIFTPKNANETKNIHNIIKLLKRTGIPKINEMSGKLGVYYDYPCVYDITFISNNKENQWINRIGTCVLTNIRTDPTTDSGFKAFNDLEGKGTPPAKITLDLTFEEMEVMSQQRIDEGY